MLKRNAPEAGLLHLTGMAVDASVAVLFAPESGARRGSGWGCMLAELPKTCGNKARKSLKLLRIEESKFSKQAKRRQERRYKQLPKQSKRTS